MWNFKWNRRWFIIIPWSWTSRLVSIYLVLCLSFAAEARDIPHYPSDDYACENVQNYYAGMEDFRGEALQKNLNSIIATHHSLSYKEVTKNPSTKFFVIRKCSEDWFRKAGLGSS